MNQKDVAPLRAQQGSSFNPSTFDPHAPDFLRDPYPTFAQFRAEVPVSFVKSYNAFWVFRYEDVQRVLSDTEDFSRLHFAKHRSDAEPAARPGAFSVLGNLPDGLFFLDPPRHGEVRSLMDDYLRRSSTEAPAIAATIGAQLLTAVKAKQSRRLELMSTFSLALPSSVVLTILGIPRGDWPGILQWVGAVEMAHDITQTAGVQGIGGTCAMALNTYFQALIHGTRDSRCPFHAERGGVMHSLATEGIGDAPLMSAEEAQATAVNLAVAGFLSASFLIGTGMLNLLGAAPDGSFRNPGAEPPIDVLRSRRELMPSAVEEMLRFDSPFQLTDRYVVNSDVMLGGVQLHVGDQVGVVIGSANRDETVFPDADVFDITRYASAEAGGGGTKPRAAPHLAFGGGIHTCYGGPLVDLIAPAAFTTLLEQLPTIRLSGTPQWKADPYLRSPSSVPLEIG